MPLQGEIELSPTGWVREQTELFERSGGLDGNTLADIPIVMVTCVGAQSGKLRKVPLMRVEHEGEYAAVASYGGSPKHPVWYYNLKAHPLVELQDGPVKKEYLARELSGEEREAWWERAVAVYAPYADYKKKTSRQIPIFVLSPVQAS